MPPQAKQLVEFEATKKKVHWTHPSFISFCGELARMTLPHVIPWPSKMIGQTRSIPTTIRLVFSFKGILSRKPPKVLISHSLYA